MSHVLSRLRTVTARAVVVTVGAALAMPAAAAAAAPDPGPPAPTPEQSGQAGSAEEAAASFSALVFSKTAGFRHGSIPAGIAAIEALGAAHDFEVDATEDSAAFTDENLAQYDVVIWLSTTGDVLNAEQQAAFERYIQAGGGYAGVHAASDTEYDWPWYGELVGSYFLSHPANQTATVKVEDPAHPSTAHLDATWQRFDEWYNFRSNPRGQVHVLAAMDESTYTVGSGAMGTDHPIAWCQDYDGGRSWYTGMGHTNESFAEPAFLEHLLGGIRTAAGAAPADCSASQTGSFEKVDLDTNTNNPMELDIAPDGTVYYIERDGRVQVVDPQTRQTSTAGRLSVFQGNEDGLLGVVLDPDFGDNGWIYLYYSPVGSEPVNRLSRFTVTDRVLDLTSERQLLDVTVQRSLCCHAGGSLQFDKDGNLLLATGDNTNPFESSGYTPIDERPGRSAYDAQGSSGNTNDLRGKVLRITPQDDGTYTVPAGNLFAPGTALTRPEIYAMGFRNPFRIGVDPQTGHVMVADYGPDAGSANPNRGPEARVEWNLLTGPGNFGWPYCHSNAAYVDFDFATNQSGAAFNCAAPVNTSPNNTGLTQLPPAIPATIWYANNGQQSNAPEIGSGGAPMGGPVYRFDADLDSDTKWPAYWDGKAFFGEWNTNKLFSFQLDAAGSAVTDINQILVGMGFLRPMDIEFGPDGALYVIEWGSGFGGNNADSGVYRIDYISGSRSPIARAEGTPTSGPAPLTVQFSSEGSRDPDGQPITFAWDFDGNGTVDSTDPSPTHTYTANGNYTAQLTVTDPDDKTAVANVPIVVGNTAPVVSIEFPENGGFIDFGDQVRYEVTVADAEDDPIDCSRVRVQIALGHDTHAHPGEAKTGCSGVLQTFLEDGHGDTTDIFTVVEATYTDLGGPGGAAPLTGRDLYILQPKLKQAEFFSSTGRLAGSTSGGDPGVQVETTGDTAGGGQNIGFIETDDWWGYEPMNLLAIDEVRLRVASPNNGARVELRSGSPTGPVVGAVDVPNTGNWQVYTDVTVTHDGSDTGESLYFVSRGAGLNVNWMRFVGRGVTENQRPVVQVSATPTTGTAPLAVDFTATATDPEGDALTYAWNFGVSGAPTPDTAEASYVYAGAGTFTATVTVTDARGASTTAAVQVRVNAPTAACLTGRSDDFLGTELDRDRWSVVRENQDLRVAGGSLVLPTTTTDIYGTNNTATPNLVLQDLPSGAWQATAKLTMEARTQYQQAGLLVYGDDDNYAKMVLQGRAAVDAPSKANRIFQFIREENGVPNEVAASNTAQLGEAFPDTVWVRFTSNGSNLEAWYSDDGTTFTKMPETKALAGIANPRIGLFALAGTGTRPVTQATFDWFNITPDDTAESPGPDDEFDGSVLDRCRWSTIVREDPGAYRVSGGFLELDTTSGDIYGGDNTGPKNFVLQPAPEGDWVVQTKVDGSAFTEQYQQGGLIAYLDDANYVKLDYLTTNAPGAAVTRSIELRSEVGDVVQNPQPATVPSSAVWHLRLAKEGSTFRGYYSLDGESWTELGTGVPNPALAAGGEKVGLFTLGAGQTASKTAKFDYFRLLDEPADDTPPTVQLSLDPAEPTGAEGWWTGPVTVTATATDDGDGQVYTEYRVDGGDWREYTAPVVLDQDGEHVVEVRASDTAGNVSEPVSRTVKVDATDPVVSIDGVEDGAELGVADVVEVSAPAVDATSGIASVTLSVDGVELGEPAELDAALLGLGEHVVTATATDRAGNSTQVSLTVSVVVTWDGARALVQRYVAEGVLDARQGQAMVRYLDQAQTQAERKQPVQMSRTLDRFAAEAGTVRDQAARALLLAVVDDLRDAL